MFIVALPIQQALSYAWIPSADCIIHRKTYMMDLNWQSYKNFSLIKERKVIIGYNHYIAFFKEISYKVIQHYLLYPYKPLKEIFVINDTKMGIMVNIWKTPYDSLTIRLLNFIHSQSFKSVNNLVPLNLGIAYGHTFNLNRVFHFIDISALYNNYYNHHILRLNFKYGIDLQNKTVSSIAVGFYGTNKTHFKDRFFIKFSKKYYRYTIDIDLVANYHNPKAGIGIIINIERQNKKEVI